VNNLHVNVGLPVGVKYYFNQTIEKEFKKQLAKKDGQYKAIVSRFLRINLKNRFLRKGEVEDKLKKIDFSEKRVLQSCGL